MSKWTEPAWYQRRLAERRAARAAKEAEISASRDPEFPHAPHVRVLARFRAKVQITNSCWLWTGAIDKNGYPRFWTGSKWSNTAHRLAFEWMFGPVPREKVMDHLCRVRHCVNPRHLEPVTDKINSNRGLAPKGHDLTPENTLVSDGGRKRRCRTCHQAWGRDRRAIPEIGEHLRARDRKRTRKPQPRKIHPERRCEHGIVIRSFKPNATRSSECAPCRRAHEASRPVRTSRRSS